MAAWRSEKFLMLEKLAAAERYASQVENLVNWKTKGREGRFLYSGLTSRSKNAGVSHVRQTPYVTALECSRKASADFDCAQQHKKAR